MSDDTREALGSALTDLLAGRTFAAFLDALDARVRALATGAEGTCSWTAKLVTGDVVRCVRAAGHVGDHDAGGHLRPWSSGRDEAREQVLADRARYKAACDNVSGALTDAGGVVPADECRYGEAVRKLTAERDEAKATAARWQSDCHEKEMAYSTTYGEWTKSKRRVAKLEELLAAALNKPKPREYEGDQWYALTDEYVARVRAALTPSAAKPLCGQCPHPPHAGRCGAYLDPTDEQPPSSCDCGSVPPAEPAAKGDGAQCGTCGGTGLVDGGEGGAMPPCPSCAAPAAGEQRSRP